MRYIIYGAGGIGGVIGGRLFQAGRDVVLICRGAHLEAIRANGLKLRAPEGDVTLPIPTAGHPRELTFTPDDCVILTMKTQDTAAALLDLETAGGGDLPIVCAQNGVDNERMAARRFARVYAMLVAMPATFLTPGVVVGSATPISGVLHSGRYPHGTDATLETICAEISASHLLAEADSAVMRLKYTKLLSNLGNAIQVITGLGRGDEAARGVFQGVQAEARACYAAAGIEFATDEEYQERVQRHLKMAPVAGEQRGGGSTWQSVVRGLTTTEVDYLNGEIVLLGALHGIQTPYNATLRRLATEIAAAGEQPGRYSFAYIERIVADQQAARAQGAL